MRLRHYLSIVFLPAVALTSQAAFAQSGVQYQVSVNTASQFLSYANIQFQFDGSPGGSQPAEADITNFTTDGVLNPPPTTTSGVSGTLPTTVTLGNSSTTVSYTEGMTFGTTITFDLDLSGSAISNPNGLGAGEFILDFPNSSQNGYLFTSASDSAPVFTVEINGDGTTTAMTYPSEGGGPPVVTFTGPTVLPEPSSIASLCIALSALGLLGRYRTFKPNG